MESTNTEFGSAIRLNSSGRPSTGFLSVAAHGRTTGRTHTNPPSANQYIIPRPQSWDCTRRTSHGSRILLILSKYPLDRMSKGMRTIIVGGGIAGLWIADRLAAAGHPVTVLEKYDYLGGRVVTARDGYEIGAGRIHHSHRRVHALIRRFGLHRVPLSADSLYRKDQNAPIETNTFGEEFAAFLVHAMSQPHLGETTLRALGAPPALLQKYPYRAEVETLRADLAIESFLHEMAGDGGFCVVREGLSAITRGLTESIKAHGGVLLTGQRVTAIEREDDIYRVKTGTATYIADRVILALHASALRHIRPVADLPLLRHLTMEPLTRIYARYPFPWFAGPRIVTDSPLRYIIPVNPAKGIVMISYTDGRDTAHWSKRSGDNRALTAAIQKEVRRLFPELEIPDPIWVRSYPWTDGCTYWKPGRYDPATLSRHALHPLPDTYPELYMCGESFSVGRQAWIEGALDHAAALLDLLRTT
jgi:monoamine oxidase